MQFRFGRSRSLGIFHGRLRRLIHCFKFEGRWTLHGTFSKLLVRYAKGYLASHDLLVAVPLTPARLSERGFNQAAVMGRSVAYMCGKPFLNRAVERRGNAPPQSSLNLERRVSNVTDTFTVRERHASSLKGRRVLLIDDVLTTGATASAAAAALLRSGARCVDVLTVARALKSVGPLYHTENRPIMK
jgi:ComF family protein